MQGSNNFSKISNQGQNATQLQAQNRGSSVDNRNHIGSRNGKNRQNAAAMNGIGVPGYPTHLNNTASDLNNNGSLLQGQTKIQNGQNDGQYRQLRTENSPQVGVNVTGQKAMSRKQIGAISENRGQGPNGVGQHQKHVTATFNKDFMDKVMKDPTGVNANAPGQKQGQGFNASMVSRNQRQSNQNAKKLVGHALTSGEAQKPTMGVLGGQFGQHNYHMQGVGVGPNNNFPAIRTSQNNGIHNLSQGAVDVMGQENVNNDGGQVPQGQSKNYVNGAAPQNQAVNGGKVVLSRQARGQNQVHHALQNQSQNARHQQNLTGNNYNNGRVFSGSGLQQRMNQNAQTQSYQPASIGGKVGLHQQNLSSSGQVNGGAPGLLGNSQGNKVNMKQNSRISGQQNRNLNGMGRIGGIVAGPSNGSQNLQGAQMPQGQTENNDQLGKAYRQQIHQQNGDQIRYNKDGQKAENSKLTLTMNRQSIQSRGNVSGTGVSVKSAKSGKSNHSTWSNLNRNAGPNPQTGVGQVGAGLGTAAANGIIANRGAQSSNTNGEKALNGSPERDFGTNGSKQAKIKEKIQSQIKNNPVLPVRSSKRNHGDALENKYFSERTGARPSSSRMGAPEQNELNKTAWNNRSSINTNTVNNGGQYASNGKPGQGTGAGNMYQLQNNGQNMILNKYLQQSNQQPDPRRPSSQKSHRNTTNTDGEGQNSQTRRGENPQVSNRQGAHGDGGSYNHSPNKARTIKEGAKNPSSYGFGANANAAASPLYKGAQNQLGGSNQDYNPKSDPRTQPSKFKGNQFSSNAAQAKPQKSRNDPNPAARLVGMTPSEQALFSSNREKSPAPPGEGTSTDADSAAEASQRNILSASARNDTANRKLVGQNPSQQSVNPPLAPSTGETGSSGGNETAHHSNASKDESAPATGHTGAKDEAHKEVRPALPPAQKSLPNKYGEYDPVIQEVEREGQQKLLQQTTPIQNIIDAQFKGLIQSNGFFADTSIGSGDSNLYNPLKEFEDAKFASKSHGLITSYSANTHQGIQRNYNEDRVSIILNMTRPENKDPATWPKCSFFAIYDGHGGSMCADFLKDHLHQIIITQACFPADPRKALAEGCRIAEERFLRMADMGSRFDKSGSCAIIVLTVETECYVANVGDSRAIMSAESGMRVIELSQDHRPNEEAEFYRIQANGGQVYQTQTFQNVPTTNQYGVVTGTQRQMLFGPYRVLPGRLSVSRTFGDIEAKFEKFGGKPGVVSSEPEISQFKIDENSHDFIVLGCDGIFDRMNSINTIDSAWSAMATALKQNTKSAEGGAHRKPPSIHQITGKMADEILKRSAIERSFDNLTIVIVSFKNILSFYDQQRKKQSKPTQAIKIEGETQSPRRPSNNRVGGSLAARAKNEREGLLGAGAGQATSGNNIATSAGYQGFHTTKAKKLKEGITSDKFAEPKKYERDNSANAKPFRTPSGTISTTQNGVQAGVGSGRQHIQSDSQARQKNPVKQSDNLNNKRTSNSTQHDRDMNKKNINNNQKGGNGQTMNLDRKRSSDQALIGGVTAINQQNKQRESRNKNRDAQGGLNSIFNNSDEYMIGGGLSGHNTTGHVPDVSRNPGLLGQSTFQKSNKDYQIQNAKYQNQQMLEQQKKIDQEIQNNQQFNTYNANQSKSQNNQRQSLINKAHSTSRK